MNERDRLREQIITYMEELLDKIKDGRRLITSATCTQSPDGSLEFSVRYVKQELEG